MWIIPVSIPAYCWLEIAPAYCSSFWLQRPSNWWIISECIMFGTPTLAMKWKGVRIIIQKDLKNFVWVGTTTLYNWFRSVETHQSEIAIETEQANSWALTCSPALEPIVVVALFVVDICWRLNCASKHPLIRIILRIIKWCKWLPFDFCIKVRFPR